MSVGLVNIIFISDVSLGLSLLLIPVQEESLVRSHKEISCFSFPPSSHFSLGHVVYVIALFILMACLFFVCLFSIEK